VTGSLLFIAETVWIDTLADTAKLMMSRLLTNYVMSFISLDGRSYGKLPFRSSPLCQVVIGQSAIVTVVV